MQREDEREAQYGPRLSGDATPPNVHVPAETGTHSGKRKRHVDGAPAIARAGAVVRRAEQAAHRMAPRRGAGYVLNPLGAEVPYGETVLSNHLVQIADHIRSHMGLGFDISKLKEVGDAKRRVKRRLGSANKRRCISLDNDLQFEGWRCFDPAYAKDSYMMALTGFAEVMAPRASDCYHALDMHLTPSESTTGARWSRYAGKNNQEVRPRVPW